MIKIADKRLFTHVCLLGLLLHGSSLYLFQKVPLSSNTHSFTKAGCNSLFMGKEEWLIETIPETPIPSCLKEDFCDLKPEFAPSFSLSTKGQLLAVAQSPTYSSQELASHKLDLSIEDDADLLLTQGTSHLEDSPLPDFGEENPTHLLLDRDFSHPREEKSQIAESDHFTVTVQYAPRRFFPGYVFKVTLVPKQEISFKKIRQNYTFLIDRSNSIVRGRYFYNKKAVSEVLSFLRPGDTFNILLFDDQIEKLATAPLAFSEDNVKKARLFLEKEGHGGCFAATDIYSSLHKIVPADVLDTEVNTAILLSDGDTYLPLEKQRQLIGGWSKKNKGKVSLFCLASGSGNNLSLLQIIATFNKGELNFVPKHEQVGERLKNLVLSLQNPIGKHLVATAIAARKDVSIYLQPKNGRLPDLFKNRGFTIFGSTSELADFTLFLQGKYYERRFDVKKKITFSEALGGTVSLEREWAEFVAQDYYEKFFQDGKVSHLQEAKEFLSPLNLTVPFL